MMTHHSVMTSSLRIKILKIDKFCKPKMTFKFSINRFIQIVLANYIVIIAHNSKWGAEKLWRFYWTCLSSVLSKGSVAI